MSSRAAVPAASGRTARVVGLFVLLAAVTALVAVPLSGLSTTASLSLLGIPDPGELTLAGLPAVRALGELAASVGIGAALFAAFFTPPAKGGTLDVSGYRAQRLSMFANATWALCAALLIPLTLSDVSGRHLSQTIAPDQWLLAISQVSVASSWRWAAILALVAAVGQRLTVSWRWSVIWVVVSALTLLPVAATGHASTSGAHDMATNGLIWHLEATAAYVGGLVAVTVHVIRGGDRQALALRRFSVIATLAIITLGISGIINTLVRVYPDELLTTTYGILICCKAAAIVVLGLLGLAMRRRIIARIPSNAPTARIDVRTFLRLASVETAVMAGTIALAVSLGRTPPPTPRYVPTVQESLLGFQLNGPLTLVRVVTQWRLDLVLGVASIIALALYLAGVRRLHRRGDSWPRGRTAAWVAGCVVMFVTTSSAIGEYMMAQFSIHMLGHMILSMLVPVLLALGGPMTLALRALPAAGRGNPPGPREWLVEFINNPVSRFLTHPVVANVQFILGFFVVYFGGFYDTLVSDHIGHMFMNIHFLISGYLFYWVIIGVDAAPRHFTPVYKMMTLVLSLPFHAFFGIMLMSSSHVLGWNWYHGLALPWVTDLLHDQRVGGGIAWAAGEIPLFIVVLALAWQWFVSDTREARRGERRAERDDDAELRAYNEMLQRMSGGHRDADGADA